MDFEIHIVSNFFWLIMLITKGKFLIFNRSFSTSEERNIASCFAKWDDSQEMLISMFSGFSWQ
jgi:hypothetical protein